MPAFARLRRTSQGLGCGSGLPQTEGIGYAAELWSRSALAGHVRREAGRAGFPMLAKAGKATVRRILAAQELQPHKIKYYLERRDPDFDRKMREVLLVYKEVELQNEALVRGGDVLAMVTAVADEKPGVQAIGNTAPDLPPVPGKYYTFARDHEYIRYGTLSILVAMDLHDGHVFAHVEERHRSVEFIALLNDLDTHYPAACTIRLVMDNHSAHISKETRDYLQPRRDPVRKDGAHVSLGHPGQLAGGTATTHPQGHRRNQPGTCCPPLEGKALETSNK